MSINFLNSVNLNQNELIKARIENKANDAAAGVGVDGQLYYDTTIDAIKVWSNGAWALTTNGFVPYTGAISNVNLGSYSLTANAIIKVGGTSSQFLKADGSIDSNTYVALTALSAVAPLLYDNITGVFSISQSTSSTNGYLSSTDWTTFNGKQNALAGTGIVVSTGGTISYITNNSTNWTQAYNDTIVSAAVTGTTSKTLTLTQRDGDTITANWSESSAGLTSAGISMPSAFSVANSPLTSNGTIAITGAGTISQYVRGDGSLATFPSIISEAQNLVTEVYNSSGAALTKGTIVYINGGQGNLPTITKAIATGDTTSAQTFGVVQNDITNMNNGYVVVSGRLSDLDTRDYTPGQQLYLSSTTAGTWTTTKQYAPAHLVYIAIVVRAHPTQGVVEVMIQNGYEMDELHNVAAQNPDNNDLLQYKTSTNLWTKVAGTTTNISEGTNLYYLDSRVRAAVSSSAPLSYNSTTGVFGITQAGTSSNGYLSSTDWNTFNNKQPAGSYVPTSRQLTINGTAYDLSADRSWSVGTVTSVSALTLGTGGTDLSSTVANSTTTPVITLNVPTASATNRGALSSADWTTFNNKQAAGNYITSLTGEATASGPGAAAVTLNNASVTGKLLTGVNITGGTVLSTDTMLTAFGKLQNQINSLIGGSIYQGVWNANTNTPTLTSSVGTDGNYYIVNVAGSTNLNGITDWKIGDWAIFHGGTWQKVDNTESVSSVNGQTGAVSLTTDNISEGSTNLYFTNSRSRSALSFTAGSGAYNSTTGVITIPTNTSQLTNGANYITLASLSGTAPIGYNNTTGAISITQAGTASNGYLSSTDWNAFNGKQAALSGTGFVKISGTTISYDNSTYALDNAVVKLTGDQSITGGKSFTTNTVYPTVVVTNNSTGSGLLLQNTSTGRGATSNNVSTGTGFYSDNTSTGIGIYSNNSHTGYGIRSANTSDGTGLYLTNSSSGTGIYSNNSSTGNGIESINSSSGWGISSSNTGSGRGIYSSNNSTGDAINIANSGTGRGIYLTNASSGKSLILNNDTAATGMPFTIQKNGTDKFTINDSGEATGVKFIKSGGTSSQFLMADGSVSTGSGGTVTSVAAITLGTTGTDLSSTVANGTTTPVITLNVPTASSTNRGALSAADWTTFNSKQNALTNPVTGTGTTNYIPKFTGSSAIGNSVIYDDGTNIAIGTTTALTGGGTGKWITLQGTAAYSGGIIGAINGVAKMYVYSESGFAKIQGASGEGVRLDVNGGTAALTAFSNGNVGINTTTDAGYKLDVNGTGRFSGYLNANYQASAANGSINIDSADPTLRFRVSGGTANKRIYEWRAIAAGTTNDRMELRTWNDAQNAASSLLSITNSGNFGIGTTSPTDGKLQVVGNTQLGNTICQTYAGVAAYSQWITSGGAFAMGLDGAAGTTERMRIASNGNVAIGTTTTANGNLTVKGGATSFELATDSSKTQMLSFDRTASAYKDFQFRAKDFIFAPLDVEKMRFTSNGELLIGTTSSLLSSPERGVIELNGGTSSIIGLKVANSLASYLYSTATDTELYSTNALKFAIYGAERMRIVTNGNVLIGTTTDAGYKLDVNGTGRFSSDLYSLFFKVTDGYGMYKPTSSTLSLVSGGVIGLTIDGASGASATFSSTVTATGFFNSSDNRLKDIISRDGDVIEFTWKDGRDNKKHIGVVAQEVQKLYPDMVQEGTDEEKTLSVNYIELLVLKNRQLEKRIESLEKLISNFK